MARKRNEEAQRPGIVVLYTSLMILLLAFFIMLNAFSTVEETKLKKAVESVGNAFGVSKGAVSPLNLDGMRPTSRFSAPINPVDQDYQSLRGMASTAEMGDKVKLLRSKSIKTLVMSDVLLFDMDSTELSPGGQEFLIQVAGIIQAREYPISIRGHTDDDVGMAGEKRNNWELSAKRALSVLRFLMGRGISPERMAAFGLAGYYPMMPNTSPQNRRWNNRVELVFDARDASYYQLPDGEGQRRLDFKGFTFDLFGGKEKKE